MDDNCDKNEIKGICFFDLDGTLLNNYTNKVPDSSLRTLDLLRQNGYKTVLSTGRDMDTHYSISYKEIVKPDAIIHQNGSKITVGDRQIFKHTVSENLLKELYDFCSREGLCIGTSIDSEDFFIHPEKKTAADKAYNRYIHRNYVPFEEIFSRKLEVTALSFAGDLNTEKEILENRFPEIKLFPFNSNKGADVVENGFSKAEGMKRICEYYGVIPGGKMMQNPVLARTFAFGDSPNDIAILEAADIGIAMGNADEIVKYSADYVTDDINKDGIYNACRHFGLVR